MKNLNFAFVQVSAYNSTFYSVIDQLSIEISCAQKKPCVLANVFIQQSSVYHLHGTYLNSDLNSSIDNFEIVFDRETASWAAVKSNRWAAILLWQWLEFLEGIRTSLHFQRTKQIWNKLTYDSKVLLSALKALFVHPLLFNSSTSYAMGRTDWHQSVKGPRPSGSQTYFNSMHVKRGLGLWKFNDSLLEDKKYVK